MARDPADRPADALALEQELAAFDTGWHERLQSKMEGTAWATSNNYFAAPSGRIVTQWPYSAIDYGLLVRLLGPPSESLRRAGERP